MRSLKKCFVVKSFTKIHLLILTFLVFMLLVQASNAQKVCVYLFYGATCPHCAAERKFLSQLTQNYPIELHEFEVYFNQSNRKLWEEICKEYRTICVGVPSTFIGNYSFIGFDEEGNITYSSNFKAYIGTKKALEEVIKYYSEIGGVPCPQIKIEEVEGSVFKIDLFFAVLLLIIGIFVILVLSSKRIKIKVKK